MPDVARDSDELQIVLQQAEVIAAEFGEREIAPAHLALALLETSCLGQHLVMDMLRANPRTRAFENLRGKLEDSLERVRLAGAALSSPLRFSEKSLRVLSTMRTSVRLRRS